MNKFSLVSKWKGKFYCPLYRVSTNQKALSVGLMLALMHVDYNVLYATPIYKTTQSEILVRGKVTSQGKGLQNVSVFVKGKKSIGTKTNTIGEFTLEVPKGSILVFTSVGFKMQEIVAISSLNVDLQEDASLLDEAVVVGFGTQKKINLTGAVDQISANNWKIARSPISELHCKD
ncbi:carboxypeptidase-like regulatory domain-containing protein [Sphingobacterium sp. KU25419]|nr:carboxypeptidase-like regulatory domain-containing protein [Sphingobacterium sp. KU25419]